MGITNHPSEYPPPSLTQTDQNTPPTNSQQKFQMGELQPVLWKGNWERAPHLIVMFLVFTKLLIKGVIMAILAQDSPQVSFFPLNVSLLEYINAFYIDLYTLS